MKIATKSKIKSIAKGLTEEILCTIYDLGQLIPRPFETPSDHVRRLRSYDSGFVVKTVNRLEKQKWVTKKRGVYVLTNLGKAKAAAYNYKKLPKRKRSDGMLTVVLFDIPQEKKHVREYLRRFLKKNEFISLQKSVFVGPWVIHKEFFKILNELGIRSMVKLLEARIL